MNNRRQRGPLFSLGVAVVVFVSFCLTSQAAAIPTQAEQTVAVEQIAVLLQDNPDVLLGELHEAALAHGGSFDLQSAMSGEGGNAPLYYRHGMVCGTGQQDLNEYCVTGEGLLVRNDAGVFAEVSVLDAITWVIDHWKGLLTVGGVLVAIAIILFILLILCVFFCKGAGVVNRVNRYGMEESMPFQWRLSDLGWKPSEVIPRALDQYYYDLGGLTTVGPSGSSVLSELNNSGMGRIMFQHFGYSAAAA